MAFTRTIMDHYTLILGRASYARVQKFLISNGARGRPHYHRPVVFVGAGLGGRPPTAATRLSDVTKKLSESDGDVATGSSLFIIVSVIC